MTKAEFLTNFQRKPVKVSIEGRDIYLMPISRADLGEILAIEEPAQRAALIAVRSICDPAGTILFKDEECDQYRRAVPLTDQEAIDTEISKLNRLGGDKGKVPSPANPDSNSSSGSPAT